MKIEEVKGVLGMKIEKVKGLLGNENRRGKRGPKERK